MAMTETDRRCAVCDTPLTSDAHYLTSVIATEQDGDTGDAYLYACEKHGWDALNARVNALPRDDDDWMIVPGYRRSGGAYAPLTS